MRSARRALRELERNELANRGEAPINLVPMIDILTVLVLYLLVGSIFRQFTILQLNLPGPSVAAPSVKPPPLQLTVTLHPDHLDLADGRGAPRAVPNAAEAYDVATLGGLLAGYKRQAPAEESVTLLLEPQIRYDALVQVMDAVRAFPADSEEGKRGDPMFPNISIGDAPKPGAPGAAR